MSWTNPTKPSVGEPTKKSFADIIVDDLLFLYSLMLSSIGSREVVINGSFETEDADNPGYPSGWTVANHGTGTFLHDESVAAADDLAIHGTRSSKFTHSGVAPNGGGTIETSDFVECTENRRLLFSWQQKCSAAGLAVIVSVEWFDSEQNSISTTVLYTSTSNPTVWTELFQGAVPANNARYFKLKLNGGDPSAAVAGTVHFDDVRMVSIPLGLDRKVEFTTAGTYLFRAPAEVNSVFQIVIGSGGAGGSGPNSASGGGGGGVAYGIAAVTPGTDYVAVVGGGSSTFNGYTANGGGAGANGAGAGGAGGTATGGQMNITGNDGDVRASSTIGGSGGSSPLYGLAGYRGDSATTANGSAGPGFGGGGGGGGGGGSGGTGSTGRIILIF